jgi:sugar lactone lactonase YvrE
MADGLARHTAKERRVSQSTSGQQGIEILVEGLRFPEGPRWHDGYLYLSDITGMAVHRYDAGGKGGVLAALDFEPSGLGFAPDGSLYVVDMPGSRVLGIRDGVTTVVADLTGIAPSFCNDMAVAADGTAYVTQFGANFWKGEMPVAAPVLRVRPGGTIDEFGPGLMMGNGIVVTQDQRALIVAEPGGGRLHRYELDAAGELTGVTGFAELEPTPSHPYGVVTPDGICLDADGAVWFADPTAHRVARVRDGGEVTDVIAFPEHVFPLAVALGGEDGRSLYVMATPSYDFYAPRTGAGLGYVAVTPVTVPAAP